MDGDSRIQTLTPVDSSQARNGGIVGTQPERFVNCA